MLCKVKFQYLFKIITKRNQFFICYFVLFYVKKYFNIDFCYLYRTIYYIEVNLIL